jgi:hypothetical protein
MAAIWQRLGTVRMAKHLQATNAARQITLYQGRLRRSRVMSVHPRVARGRVAA